MIGRLLCRLGFHKWIPDGPIRSERRSKYDIIERAKGKCERGCGARNEISRSVDY